MMSFRFTVTVALHEALVWLSLLGTREETPNDPKLRDSGGRALGAGWSAAASVTPGAVRGVQRLVRLWLVADSAGSH